MLFCCTLNAHLCCIYFNVIVFSWESLFYNVIHIFWKKENEYDQYRHEMHERNCYIYCLFKAKAYVISLIFTNITTDYFHVAYKYIFYMSVSDRFTASSLGRCNYARTHCQEHKPQSSIPYFKRLNNILSEIADVATLYYKIETDIQDCAHVVTLYLSNNLHCEY